MKKFLVLFITICLLVMTSCMEKKGTSPATEKTVAKKAEILEIIPTETDIVVISGSVSDFYKNFSITENSFFGMPMTELDEVVKNLGFNPFKLEDLENNGFDTKKEIALLIDEIKIGTTGEAGNMDIDEENSNAIFTELIPVKDKDKVLALISMLASKAKEDGANLTLADEDGFTVLTTPDNIKVYIKEKNNYLVISLSASPEVDAKPYVTSFMSATSVLADNAGFENVFNKVNGINDLFAYMKFSDFAEKNMELLKSLNKAPAGTPDLSSSMEFMKDYQDFAISINYSTKDFIIKTALSIKENSEVLKLVSNMNFKRDVILGMDKNPVLFLSGALNVDEYYKYIMGMIPAEQKAEFDAQLKEGNEKLGLDIEKDIIGNLDNNFSLGIFDGGNISMVSYNTLLSIPVKDGNKAVEVIDKMIKMLSPEEQMNVQKSEENGIPVYKYNMGMSIFVLGIKDNTILIGSDKGTFDAAAKGAKDRGFLSKISDSELKSVLGGDYNVFYLNIDEASKVLRTFGMFLQSVMPLDDKLFNTIGKFEHVIAYSWIDGNMMYSDFKVKTRFDKPFFIGIKGLVDSYTKPETQAQKQ